MKVSVNDFIIKASALALMSVPQVNTTWDVKKEEVVSYGYNADISIAVATDKGLITPIVKAAQFKSITDISADIQVFIYFYSVLFCTIYNNTKYDNTIYNNTNSIYNII